MKITKRTVIQKTEKPKESIRRVAVYCRVSTQMEIQEGSFELQKEHFLQKIEACPTMILADVYGDLGKSGRCTRGRKDFQRMLRDCEEGKIDLILTKSISRFARSFIDCIETIRRLNELGIPIIFEENGIDTGTEKNELLLGILASVAEEESNSLSENMQWVVEEKNAKGQPIGGVSYGYRRGRRETEWRIEETEARRVRYAFEQAANCVGFQTILDGLNAMEAEEETGLVWSRGRLGYLLSNICYMGDYLTAKLIRVGRKQIKNNGSREQYYLEEHHDGIVSREMFQRVQTVRSMHLLRSNRRRYSDEQRAVLEDTSWKNTVTMVRVSAPDLAEPGRAGLDRSKPDRADKGGTEKDRSESDRGASSQWEVTA